MAVPWCRTTCVAISPDCLTALAEVATEDAVLSSSDCMRPNDGLSPWDHTVSITKSAHSPRPPRSGTRGQTTTLPCRPHTTPGCSINHQDPVRSHELTQKNHKFRGILHTLLSSERQHVEPSFQHLEDSRDYMQHYRQLHHPHGAVVRPADGDTRQGPVAQWSSGRPRLGKSAVSVTGHTTKRCSSAQRCPHYVPRSPCIKTEHQRVQSSPAGAEKRSNPTTTAISVRGSRLDTGQRYTARRSQGARRRFHISRTIIAETQSCKRIRLTWHQYLKYFSKPEQNTKTQDEKNSKSGYAERPSTPSSNPSSPRAATCLPDLGYDQSRVGTHTSLFRSVDQSAKRKQLQPGGGQQCDDSFPENGHSLLGQPYSEKQRMCESVTTYGVHSHRFAQ
ncbi:hypothetical protein ACOMHN_056814 [Nucella lapillus]